MYGFTPGIYTRHNERNVRNVQAAWYHSHLARTHATFRKAYTLKPIMRLSREYSWTADDRCQARAHCMTSIASYRSSIKPPPPPPRPIPYLRIPLTKQLTHNMSGTQSPPLELTGEEKVLGASATNKPAGTANVKTDAEQRGGELNFSPSAARRARCNHPDAA